MKRSLLLVAVILAVLGIQVSAYGAFCAGIYSNSLPYYASEVFCDDFDRYCDSPPPYPDRCPDGSLPDYNGARGTWSPMDSGLPQCPGTGITVSNDDLRIQSPLFGGRYPCQGNAHLGQQEVNLVPSIQAKFGSQYTAIKGGNVEYTWPPGKTGAVAGDALNLIFTMNGGNCPDAATGNCHIQYDNGYMELGLDSEEGAPMDFVKVGWGETESCNSCYAYCTHLGIKDSGVHVAWPSVCQSYNRRIDSPQCPPMMTNVRKAIAVGAVAILDNNPCHCETVADQVPQNNHLAYYDGLAWRSLKSGMPGVTSGDFTLGSKKIEVQLLVKMTTVKILMMTFGQGTNPPVDEVSTAELPRMYTGEFNKLRLGVNHGCELANGAYTCLTGPGEKDSCFRTSNTRCDSGEYQDSKASNIVFDNIWIRGGYAGVTQTLGSCCLPDSTTCEQKSQTECQALGGTFGGIGASCSTAVCCYTPWADTDGDGDVDMDDFANFQQCFTIGAVDPALAGYCRCLDRGAGSSPVKDGGIDFADLSAFLNCASGPSIPWSQADSPLCVP